MKKLLISLALFLSLSIQPVHSAELTKIRINDFSGGRNSYDLSDLIGNNQGSEIENIVLSKKGLLQKRTGQALFAQDESDAAFSGIGRYDPDAHTSFLFVASGPIIQYTPSSPASWIKVNEATPLSTGYDTEFIQANDLLFILNGKDPTCWWNGSAYVQGTTDVGSPPVASTAVWLRNYMFTAGDPSHPDWVSFSNNLVPDIYTSTDVFKVNTGGGQPVIKLESFKLNELIIYLSRSVYLLDITGLIPLTNWTLQPITKSTGCAAPRSVVNLGNDQWFLSTDPITIRSLSRTSYDKLTIDMVSQPIQDIFDGTGDTTINKTYMHKSCAVLFDNKYILAIPTGSSIYNNLTIVYDFISKSWYTIDGWFPGSWLVFDNSLYYTDAKDGFVVKCFTGTTGDISSGPIVSTASEPSVAIDFKWISKNFDCENPENYKMPDALDMEFGTTGNYNADIYASLDDGDWQSIGNINLAGSAPTLPLTLPFTLGSDGVARKTFQLQRYGEFKKIKFKVAQTGYEESCELHSLTLFYSTKTWRRE